MIIPTGSCDFLGRLMPRRSQCIFAGLSNSQAKVEARSISGSSWSRGVTSSPCPRLTRGYRTRWKNFWRAVTISWRKPRGRRAIYNSSESLRWRLAPYFRARDNDRITIFVCVWRDRLTWWRTALTRLEYGDTDYIIIRVWLGLATRYYRVLI